LVDEGGRGNRGERAGGSCLVWLEGLTRRQLIVAVLGLLIWTGAKVRSGSDKRHCVWLADLQLQVAPCLVRVVMQTAPVVLTVIVTVTVSERLHST